MIGRFLAAAAIGLVALVLGLALLVHVAPATSSTVAWVASVAHHAVATVTRTGGAT